MDGDSLYKRKFKVNGSNPKECEKAITQEIFVALSEDNSVSAPGEKRRTLKAEFVANGTLDDTLESRSAASASQTFMSESAFQSQNDSSLLVEIEQDGEVSSAGCQSLSAIFCNAF